MCYAEFEEMPWGDHEPANTEVTILLKVLLSVSLKPSLENAHHSQYDANASIVGLSSLSYHSRSHTQWCHIRNIKLIQHAAVYPAWGASRPPSLRLRPPVFYSCPFVHRIASSFLPPKCSISLPTKLHCKPWDTPFLGGLWAYIKQYCPITWKQCPPSFF